MGTARLNAARLDAATAGATGQGGSMMTAVGRSRSLAAPSPPSVTAPDRCLAHLTRAKPRHVRCRCLHDACDHRARPSWHRNSARAWGWHAAAANPDVGSTTVLTPPQQPLRPTRLALVGADSEEGDVRTRRLIDVASRCA